MKRLCFWIVLLFASREVFAGPAMAVLEYRQKNTASEETGRLADRLRDEFQRRFGQAVLGKKETEDLFYYHKQGVLQRGPKASSRLLEEGKKAFFQLELPEAEEIFNRLIQEADGETLAEATLLFGLTKLAAGDEAAARKAFQETLRLDPGRELHPDFFPPRTLRIFKKAARAARLPTGRLRVTAIPEGAEVRINGVLQGLTPLDLPKFPSGIHEVRIQAGHYEPVSAKIDLVAGSERVVHETLRWRKERPVRRFLGLSEGELGDVHRLAEVGAALGSEMAVSKILFVNYLKGGQVETRIVDASLRTSYKPLLHPAEKIGERSAEISAAIAERLTDQLADQLASDLKRYPSRFAENRYQGDVILIGHHRRPFYKRPLFWVMLGAGAASGGLTAAFAGGAAATGSLGILFP